ncbi:aminotransferase class I/II-fold pyridoxal phosphate-dependent enzyme [Nocardia yunnanensis]|uniref:Aminotransferase class I/II-fold pyridoxal phosphate-dependent enzyme n=1 Tax=Nocardia yunnanensis TaxID=2382165 RepID=A0A386ZAS4_9NOCA|nr:aminotransferase class I/II-fold pyridoxal phosphate-dependent enzyme [Nocardia yunnanensis]AYF74771.1 aminotransferase class I/II-fold pyridoxal phosphate-dependent enzyme [Nocardia yunnanensis]
MNPLLVERLRPYSASVFEEISRLATAHDAVDLGQGFPDYEGPAAMLELARAAISGGMNHYSSSKGQAALREAIVAERAARLGCRYDAADEVLVTAGATEALTAAMLALVEPGADVVLIEPYYDSYAAAVAMAGAIPRTVAMVPDGDGFTLDLDELHRAITPRTRLLVVNSPHNPTGSLLRPADLRLIAELARAHDFLIVSDEVYEHLVFDTPHLSIATLPGMRERTVVVSSPAKTFHVTGWRIGWALGPTALIHAIHAAKQYLSFVSPAPFQPAVAHALLHEQHWAATNRAALRRKHDLLATALTALGLPVKRSAGGYFVCADVGSDGTAFCRTLPARAGVAAIPVAALAARPHWNTLVRFAYCKRDDTLHEAIARLAESL